MKILGTVVHTSSHRNLIVRGDEIKQKMPKINSMVFDQKMNQIGKINDVFGPVKCPYFSVRLFKNVANDSLRDFKRKHVYV